MKFPFWSRILRVIYVLHHAYILLVGFQGAYLAFGANLGKDRRSFTRELYFLANPQNYRRRRPPHPLP